MVTRRDRREPSKNATCAFFTVKKEARAVYNGSKVGIEIFLPLLVLNYPQLLTFIRDC